VSRGILANVPISIVGGMTQVKKNKSSVLVEENYKGLEIFQRLARGEIEERGGKCEASLKLSAT